MSKKNIYGIGFAILFPLLFIGVLQLPFSLTTPVSLEYSIPEDEIIVFFGFTKCPAACPVTLGLLADAYEQVSEPQRAVYFINTTPADSANEVQAYAQGFHPDFHGLQMPEGGLPSFKKHFGITLDTLIQGQSLVHSTDLFILKSTDKKLNEWKVEGVYKSSPPKIPQLINLIQGQGMVL